MSDDDSFHTAERCSCSSASTDEDEVPSSKCSLLDQSYTTSKRLKLTDSTSASTIQGTRQIMSSHPHSPAVDGSRSAAGLDSTAGGGIIPSAGDLHVIPHAQSAQQNNPIDQQAAKVDLSQPSLNSAGLKREFSFDCFLNVTPPRSTATAANATSEQRVASCPDIASPTLAAAPVPARSAPSIPAISAPSIPAAPHQQDIPPLCPYAYCMPIMPSGPIPSQWSTQRIRPPASSPPFQWQLNPRGTTPRPNSIMAPLGTFSLLRRMSAQRMGSYNAEESELVTHAATLASLAQDLREDALARECRDFIARYGRPPAGTPVSSAPTPSNFERGHAFGRLLNQADAMRLQARQAFFQPASPSQQTAKRSSPHGLQGAQLAAPNLQHSSPELGPHPHQPPARSSTVKQPPPAPLASKQHSSPQPSLSACQKQPRVPAPHPTKKSPPQAAPVSFGNMAIKQNLNNAPPAQQPSLSAGQQQPRVPAPQPTKKSPPQGARVLVDHVAVKQSIDNAPQAQQSAAPRTTLHQQPVSPCLKQPRVPAPVQPTKTSPPQTAPVLVDHLAVKQNVNNASAAQQSTAPRTPVHQQPVPPCQQLPRRVIAPQLTRKSPPQAAPVLVDHVALKQNVNNASRAQQPAAPATPLYKQPVSPQQPRVPAPQPVKKSPPQQALPVVDDHVAGKQKINSTTPAQQAAPRTPLPQQPVSRCQQAPACAPASQPIMKSSLKLNAPVAGKEGQKGTIDRSDDACDGEEGDDEDEEEEGDDEDGEYEDEEGDYEEDEEGDEQEEEAAGGVVKDIGQAAKREYEGEEGDYEDDEEGDYEDEEDDEQEEEAAGGVVKDVGQATKREYEDEDGDYEDDEEGDYEDEEGDEQEEEAAGGVVKDVGQATKREYEDEDGDYEDDEEGDYEDEEGYEQEEEAAGGVLVKDVGQAAKRKYEDEEGDYEDDEEGDYEDEEDGEYEGDEQEAAAAGGVVKDVGQEKVAKREGTGKN
ncbi:hypothetical protein GOP47_0025526 [Adiantum capillus-veneris]|uniref:Uncharacterized protein n=1 Tax=Adiantum capillus-veneris TaxID=13818 RepID=A0A9D4U0V9_ADICA|nr:hypothetical protein GOP47_0025526 [Adiantum capillus-veneris]